MKCRYLYKRRLNRMIAEKSDETLTAEISVLTTGIAPEIIYRQYWRLRRLTVKEQIK